MTDTSASSADERNVFDLNYTGIEWQDVSSFNIMGEYNYKSSLRNYILTTNFYDDDYTEGSRYRL